MTNKEYAVETFSLTKVFSDWWGRDKVYAVDNLNLRIHYNEVFGLLGPNGSGKTTTLKLLLGLLHPTKGRYTVLGGDSTDPKINKRIGFMPEESYLYKYLNARETLDFYGRLFRLPARVRKARIEALLEMVGLKAVANRPIGTFSKGMARRIGLAQALINDPDLLILDEPTTGLDPLGTRQIKNLIIQLAKRGKTILLCSHLLADVEDVCDRIAILYGGKIQTKGRVKELLTQTDKKQITIGNISDNAVEQIEKIIQNEQADYDITSPMDKLETFFIKTVAAARGQGKTTSGVISDSATKISDFLVSKPLEPDILDKLVTAEVLKDSTAESTTTQQAKPVQTTEQKPDDKLISKLTEQTQTVQPAHVEETKPVEQDEQIKKSILDQLTSDNSEQQDKPQADSSQGDSDNA